MDGRLVEVQLGKKKKNVAPFFLKGGVFSAAASPFNAVSSTGASVFFFRERVLSVQIKTAEALRGWCERPPPIDYS